MGFKRFLSLFSAACILGLLAAAISFTPVAANTGTLTLLSPSTPSGTVGSTVIIGGSGFTSSVLSGNVYFDTVPFPVTLNGSGGFTAVITVPALTPGGYLISAIIGSDPANVILFNVVASSTFSLSAYSGFVGDSVSVTGSGFSPSAATLFYWDGASAPFASLTASSSGAISGPITIPATARGPHTITASLAGTPPQTFSVGSSLVLSPTTGGVGDAVSLTGTGYAATASITIAVDGVPVSGTSPSSVVTNTTGGFTASFIMPAVASGVRTIQASDIGGSDATPPTFTVGPKISLATNSGIVGSNVLISGTGFSALQNLTVQIETAPGSGVYSTLTTIPVVPSADSTGAFGGTSSTNPISFAIPGIAGGTYKIKVTDQSAHSATASVTVLPTLSITPGNGTVGTQVTVSGSGFAAGLGVNLFWDTSTISTTPASVTSSATGTISVTFVSPPGAGGSHSVKAQDTQGNTATATFSTKPKIVLTPATGGYGDTITVTYSGFTASSTVTSTQIVSGSTAYALTTSPSTVSIDATGNGSATFKVINIPNGSWTVQATDSTNGSVQATLAVTQKITLSTTTGAAGDVVAITGTGFSASQGITFKYNGVALSISPSVSSDANGAFACQFTVPSTPAGAIPLTASDGNNVASATFSASDKASISTATTQSSPGYVGMSLTVSGTGFKASATITLTFASAPVTLTTVTSDTHGSFSATFTVPAAPGGNHTISASDGTTTETFPFFMDSTAPAAPTLGLPADKAKPKQPVAFSWDAVTDPSGVTYTFEVSQDPTFATLLVQHTGLTAASYTMTSAEKLKTAGSGTPYYWRVQATDGAGNASAWSTSNTFTIGFIWPWWMIHVWYGLGIIVALILGLWLGRRMAYRSY